MEEMGKNSYNRSPEEESSYIKIIRDSNNTSKISDIDIIGASINFIDQEDILKYI